MPNSASRVSLDDFPEDWLESTAAARRGCAATAQACGRSRSPSRRPAHRLEPAARLVYSRQVSLLPGLQGSAARTGSRDQQARRTFCGRAQLGDHAAGFERGALDESAAQPALPPTSASSSASPTTVRMPRCRPATSTISCSSRSYAPPSSLPFAEAGADGFGEEEFGRTIQAALGFTAANRGAAPGVDARSRGQGRPPGQGASTLSRVLAYRVWADQRRGWRFTNPNLEELGSSRPNTSPLMNWRGRRRLSRARRPSCATRCRTRAQRLVVLLDICGKAWRSPRRLSIQRQSTRLRNASRQSPARALGDCHRRELRVRPR